MKPITLALNLLPLLPPLFQPSSACFLHDTNLSSENIAIMTSTVNKRQAAGTSYIPPTPPPNHPEFIIANVTIFDGTNVLPSTYNFPSTPQSPHINGTNRTLLPGLVDSHLHIHAQSEFDVLIAAGITSALDMGCSPPSFLSTVRTWASAQNTTVRPGFHSAGTIAISPDSPTVKLHPELFDVVFNSSERGYVADWVGERLAEGNEYIKMISDEPGSGLTREMLGGLAREARGRGKMSVVHAATVRAWEMAVYSGGDVVTHVPMDGVVEDGVLSLFGKKGGGGGEGERRGAAVPTLTMSRAMARSREGGNESYVEEVLGYSFQTVRKLHEAQKKGGGVVVLAGTDANDIQGMSIPHGRTLIEELEFFVDRAGFQPVEALRSATSLPADWWGLDGRGVVMVGAKADLLLVDGEPWRDVGMLRNVVGVWREGRAAVLKEGS